MFDPRNIWIGMGLFVALYLAYAAPQPTKSVDDLSVAYLRETAGSETKLTKIDRSLCRSMKQRLWGHAERDVECIAYFTPGNQPQGETAIIYFHGDFTQANQTAQRMASSQKGFQRRANQIAHAYGIPVYVIARPGVMGSTGFHTIGGVREEYQLVSTAIDELKQRHGIQHLILAGQSGGARLVAQMLVSGRKDISCAVMASGAYGLPRLRGGGRSATNIWGEPSHSILVPLRSIDGVVMDRKRRLFVVGDPRDMRTLFDEQRQWAEALRDKAHHALLLEGAGGGKEFHYLTDVAMHVAGMCGGGQSDDEISHFVKVQKAGRKR